MQATGALAIRCPECGAPARTPCHNPGPDGRDTFQTHEARIRKASLAGYDD